MFVIIWWNICRYVAECLSKYSGMFVIILRNVCHFIAECLSLCSGMFVIIPRNVCQWSTGKFQIFHRRKKAKLPSATLHRKTTGRGGGVRVPATQESLLSHGRVHTRTVYGVWSTWAFLLPPPAYLETTGTIRSSSNLFQRRKSS